MRAGRLDRLITIQRKTSTASDSGEPQDTWAALGELRRPASIAPVRGDERFDAPQIGAQEQVEFRIRYSSEVAGLSPQDRIIYPALTADSPAETPSERYVYNILAAPEIGRREGFQIIAVRRPDAIP